MIAFHHIAGPAWRIALTATLFLAGTAPLAAREPIHLNRIPTKLGLSQNLITCLLQDRQGFLWVGTKDGLNRFDGYDFVVYQYDPYDSTTLSDSYIKDLVEDRHGRLWVGTQNGLNLLDRHRDVAHRFYPDSANPASLPNANISFNGLIEDAEGGLWVGTAGGLCRIVLAAETANPRGARITRVAGDPDDPASLDGRVVHNMALDGGGTLWLDAPTLHTLTPAEDGSSATLTAFQPELSDPRWQEQFTGPENQRRIYPGRHGAIWIGIGPGIIRWSPRKADVDIWRFWEQPTPLQYTWWENAGGLYEDSTGTVWIGTLNGLARFDSRTGTFTEQLWTPGETEHLPEYGLTEILGDRAGVLWFGSNGNGLFRHDTKSRRFERPGRNGLPGVWRVGSMRGIHKTRDGRIWLGPARGGFFQLDHPTGNLIPVPWPRPDLDWGRVLSMHESAAGDLWVASSNGLFRVSRDGKRLGPIAYFDPEPEPYWWKSVFSIHEDGNGEIWCTTRRYLCRIDADADTLIKHRLPPDRDPTFFKVSEYLPIHEDRRGDFWVGTVAGLLRFRPSTGEFHHYRNDPTDRTSLSHPSVRAICADPDAPDRYLWIGTAGGGLNRFDVTDGSFTHYSEASGLPDNVIYGILPDGSGHLWMSTNKGLVRFDPRSAAIRTFDAADGLQDNEFNSNAYFRAADGELFFGGITGFNRFYPDDIRDNLHRPPVVLTGFSIFNRPVSIRDPESPLTAAISRADEIRLSYADKVFSLEFAALDFTDPAKNRYAYRMAPFDDAWQDAGTNRLATYTNLDPGEYTFTVKGSNSDGVWNEAGHSLRVIITPPWWQTWWAYLGYGLFLAIGVFTIDRSQRRRLIARERQRAALREAQLRAESAEAASEAKSDFLSNVSHELRTPLTSVLGFAKLVRKRLDDRIFPLVPTDEPRTHRTMEQIMANLDVMISEGERLTALINNVLDLSRIEAGKVEWMAEPVAIGEVIRRAGNATAALFSGRELTFTQAVDAELPTVIGDRDKLIQVVVNLIANAVKFTERGGVSCAATRDGGHIRVSVRDTGVGIPPEDRERVFQKFTQAGNTLTEKPTGTGLGLAICREIVEHHGGGIGLDSEVGQGSTFFFTLPIERSDDHADAIPQSPPPESPGVPS